jgi:hypothetical protein
MPDHIPAINLVANCTARKKRIPDPRVCLRSLATESEGERLTQWLSRLHEMDNNATCTAGDLYCGDGWSSIKTAIAKFRETAPLNLWVASAGYGLLSSEDMVVPYSATFSSGQDDSVAAIRDSAGNQRWWRGLTKRWAKMSRPVSSVSELASAFPSSPLLVGVSPDYLWAMMPDLLAASVALVDPDLLVIVSAGTKKADALTPFLLPCDARLEHRLGGARSSLNARIVAYILNKFRAEELRMPILQKHFKNILSRAPEARTYHRKRMTEKQVETFIRKALRKAPGASFSALLRNLRDSGLACEYKRFREMFRALTPPATNQK